MIIDKPQALEHFIVDRYMCLFIVFNFCDQMVTVQFDWITITAAGKQFQSFCNYERTRILLSLKTSFDSGPNKSC